MTEPGSIPAPPPRPPAPGYAQPSGPSGPRASFGRRSGPAPDLGADTDAVLAEGLGMSAAEIAQLRATGALG